MTSLRLVHISLAVLPPLARAATATGANSHLSIWACPVGSVLADHARTDSHRPCTIHTTLRRSVALSSLPQTSLSFERAPDCELSNVLDPDSVWHYALRRPTARRHAPMSSLRPRTWLSLFMKGTSSRRPRIYGARILLMGPQETFLPLVLSTLKVHLSLQSF